jgi:putative ABC transport system permease protein
MNNCRANLDLVVFLGLPPEKLKSAWNLRLAAGEWSTFERQRDAALVGRALAQRRGLEVGKKFSIGEVTVTVAGIVTTRDLADENFLYTHLEFLQRIRGLNSVGTVTQFEVQLRDGADPNAVCRALDAQFLSHLAALICCRRVPTNVRFCHSFQKPVFGRRGQKPEQK